MLNFYTLLGGIWMWLNPENIVWIQKWTRSFKDLWAAILAE